MASAPGPVPCGGRHPTRPHREERAGALVPVARRPDFSSLRISASLSLRSALAMMKAALRRSSPASWYSSSDLSSSRLLQVPGLAPFSSATPWRSPWS
jgi:hypothetical protein